jgi:hypothetical protein
MNYPALEVARSDMTHPIINKAFFGFNTIYTVLLSAALVE